MRAIYRAGTMYSRNSVSSNKHSSSCSNSPPSCCKECGLTGNTISRSRVLQSAGSSEGCPLSRSPASTVALQALSGVLVLLVTPALPAHHLVSQHQHTLDGELPAAEVEQILQARPQEVYHHDIVLSLNAIPAEVRNASCNTTSNSSSRSSMVGQHSKK